MAKAIWLLALIFLAVNWSTSRDAKKKKVSTPSTIVLHDKNLFGYLFSKKDILVDPTSFVTADTAFQNEIQMMFKAAGFVWNKTQQFVMLYDNGNVPNCRASESKDTTAIV